MLYQAYELRSAIQKRSVGVMDLNVKVFSKILAPVRGSLPVRASVAATEVARMVQLTHERPSFDVPVVNGSQDDSVVRDEVVTSTPFASLVHFVRSDVSPAARPKVLIVPGLAGHFATLVRGTISTMLQDHDVYVVDWHNARDVPVSAGRFGLDEYIEHLMTFLREIGPGTHLMGICQPAVACIVTAAIMAEDGDPAEPASLILLAGPVDTRVNPGPVNRSAGKQSMTLLKRTMLHTVPRGYVGAGRTVYPAFLQVSGFLSMDPRRHLRAFNGLFRDVKDGNEADARRTKEFYAEYFAMLDVAGEFFLETVRSVFKDNDLPRGNFYWRGRHVDPSLIRSALFTIEGGQDEMCCPGQTEAAHAICSGIPASRSRHHVQPDVGHYGVFAGSRFETQIYPKIQEFIADASALLARPAIESAAR